MIVIDLGCAAHEDERSIEPLIERFHPDVLYGFDPWPEMRSRKYRDFKLTGETESEVTHVILDARAAWIYDGFIGYQEDGLRSRVNEASFKEVPCFDLAEFIWGLPATVEVVCKMDVETSEIPLLEHLYATGADSRLSLALIEWHDAMGDIDYAERKAAILESLRCEVEPW